MPHKTPHDNLTPRLAPACVGIAVLLVLLWAALLATTWLLASLLVSVVK